MNQFDDQWRQIYIDDAPRMATKSRIPDLVKDSDGVFFVDSEKLPCRRCSAYHLERGATDHLERDGRIFTSGKWYSLKPKEKDRE